jgi:hypothetical protein
VMGKGFIDLRYNEQDSSYSMDGVCGNCGWQGNVRINKGDRAPHGGLGGRRAPCPNCGCREVTVQMPSPRPRL